MNDATGHRNTHRLTWRIGGTFVVLLAAYLVIRAGVELVRIDYGDAASYRNDWGGPSLAGVLAVHVGPGSAILACLAIRARRLIGKGSGA